MAITLKDDFDKLVARVPVPIIHYTVIDSFEGVVNLFKQLTPDNLVVLDLETNSLIPHEAHITCMGLCIDGDCFILTQNVLYEQRTKIYLQAKLRNLTLCYWNGKYDTSVLYHYLKKTWVPLTHDAMILTFAYDETRLKYGLKHIVKALFGHMDYSEAMKEKYKNPFKGRYAIASYGFIECPGIVPGFIPIEDFLAPVLDKMYPIHRMLSSKGKKGGWLKPKKVIGSGLLYGRRSTAYWDNIPKSELYRYCALDTYYTYLIFMKFKELYKKDYNIEQL